MTHIERIEALLAGKKLDSTAINLWKHFPPYDEKPTTDLVKKCIQFQDRFDWDFVKITYHGYNSIQDWGAQITWPVRDCEWPNTTSKVGTLNQLLIKKAPDWKKLTVLDPSKGTLGENVECTRILADHYKGQVPVVVTVFNPLTTAMKMGGDNVLIHARSHEEEFKAGLEVITETTVRYVKALAEAGAAGIFLATQLGTYDKMSLEEYKKWGEPTDRAVLEACKGMWFNIMHMHGEAPMFELLSKYPVQAINWHDRLAEDFALATGRKLCPDKILIGGVEEYTTLFNGTDEEVKAQLTDAINQVPDGRLILGPGCCVPLNVPEDRLELAKKILATI